MKSRVLKFWLCIIILFSLLVTSFALVRPIYLSLGNVMRSKFALLNNQLEKSYGVNVKYKSMSPSILNGINIKNIVVTDALSSQEIVSIKKATVKYSLKKIIERDFVNVISKVVIYNVDAKIDLEKNSQWIDFLIKNDEEKKSQNLVEENSQNDSFQNLVDLLLDKKIDLKIPVDISVNNLKFSYNDSKNKMFFSGDFRRLFIEKTLLEGKYNVAAFGKIESKILQNNFSATVNLRSSLLSKIENSTAVIQFYNSKFNEYSISQIGFLSEFYNDIFSFKMLPSVQNIYTEFFANLKTKNLSLNFDCNNFKISNLVKGIKKNSVLKDFEEFILSTSASVNYNLQNKKIFYSANGAVDVPPLKNFFVENGANVNFAFNGNQNYLTISSLSAKNENVDVEFNGGINLSTPKIVTPEGTFFINKIALKNNEIASAEFFLEPLDNGFMIFSPEIAIGKKTFTAAQFNLVPTFDGFDFDFEVSDYSHIESGEEGKLRFVGSYLTKSKFLQTNVGLEGLYIDSVLETASCFVEKGVASFLEDSAPIFKNTIFTTDIYLTSYDGNFSYSVPTVLIADTLSDNKMLSFSLDGNKENIQLNNFEFIFNNQKILASAQSENIFEPETHQMQTILTSLVEYNSIPYNFSGLVSKEWFSLTGDYGFNFSLMLDSATQNLLGNFALKEFPLKFSKSIFSFSADTNFYYNEQEKINLNLQEFIVQLIDDDFSNDDAAFSLSGKIDKSGAYFDKIGFIDNASNLLGNGNVFWNFVNADFQNATYSVNLSDPIYNEQVSLNGDVSNPAEKPFSLDSLLKDYYISSMINISNLRTNRFFKESSNTDTLNAEISVTGILSNPLVSLNVPNGKATINKELLSFSFFASVVDLEFELQNANVKFGQTEFSNIKSKFNFNDWKGNFDFDATTYVADQTLIAPIKISFDGIKNKSQKEFFPKSFELNIDSAKLSGTFIKKSNPLNLKLIKMDDDIFISSSKNIGLTGSILNDGNLSLKVENQVPFNFKVEGNLKRKSAPINFFDVEIDLEKTFKLINFPLLKIYSGKVIGDFKIVGAPGNKYFDGELQIIPFEFTTPDYFTKHAKTDIVYVTLSKDAIFTPKTQFFVNRSPVDVTLTVPMNNLMPDGLSVLVKTVDDTFAPVAINLEQVHVKGNAQLDLDINVEENSISVLGSVVTKDTTAEFGTTTIEDMVGVFSNPDVKNPMDVQVALDVKMQSRVQVFYSSFLRGLVVPNSDVVFKYSSIDDKITLDGDVFLRSGEIIYLNSSFYIKDGRLQFAETDGGINPYVSLQAETREQDSKGEEVKISLSVDHQRLNDLAPKLTSSPARSEKEIMELLGNFVSAKSEDMSSFMLATGDYALQTMVMRRVENSLRDLLNFDILSIRTTVVQNALKFSISRDSDRQGLKIGNFFDNTTVYIGKYFGNALYADAMLRLTYDKNRINDKSTLQGLIFKPEIGLEMDSPVAKIRWSVTPDFSELNNMKIILIPSLTLSWRFNF